MAKEKSGINGEMKVQFPDRNIVKCKDCIHRDKTIVKLGKNDIQVGVTKSFCEIYKGPPDDNGKPLGILFNKEDCAFYAKEERG